MDKQDKINIFRAKIKEMLSSKREVIQALPSPRYDDVYFNGIAALASPGRNMFKKGKIYSDDDIKQTYKI